MVGAGQGEPVQVLETLGAWSRWLCSVLMGVMTPVIHQESPTQALFRAGFSSYRQTVKIKSYII